MSAIAALSPHNSESEPTVYPYIDNSVRNRGTRLLNIHRWCFDEPSLFEVTSSEGGNLRRTPLSAAGGGSWGMLRRLEVTEKSQLGDKYD